MKIFSALLAIFAGNSPVTGKFLAQRPVTRSFDVFFECARINGWVNNREVGDLRRHCAHYDVIVISHLNRIITKHYEAYSVCIILRLYHMFLKSMMTSSNGSIFCVTGLYEGNPPVTGALMFSLICGWSNVWANNQDVDDARRHLAVIMTSLKCTEPAFTLFDITIFENCAKMFRSVVTWPTSHFLNQWWLDYRRINGIYYMRHSTSMS